MTERLTAAIAFQRASAQVLRAFQTAAQVGQRLAKAALPTGLLLLVYEVTDDGPFGRMALS